ELGSERRHEPQRQAPRAAESEPHDVERSKRAPGAFGHVETSGCGAHGVNCADGTPGNRGEPIDARFAKRLQAADVVRAFRAAAREDQADAPAPEILWGQMSTSILTRNGGANERSDFCDQTCAATKRTI